MRGCFTGTEPVMKDERVLEKGVMMVYSNVYRTNTTFKDGEGGKFHVMCILPQFKCFKILFFMFKKHSLFLLK